MVRADAVKAPTKAEIVRASAPSTETEPGDQYLKAAVAAGIPVSVQFQDGEIIDGKIEFSGRFSLLITEDNSDRTLVFKSAIKKITKRRLTS